MTTYGDFMYVGKQLFVNGKEVSGGNSGDQNLAEVLAVGGDANQLPIFNTGTITTAAAPESVAAKQADIKADVVETRFVNSSFMNTIEATATTISATDITSSGTLNWNAFNPPLVVSGTPALSQVLGAGDNAGTLYVQDCGKLTFEKKEGDTQSEIVGVVTEKTKCLNLDLSDSTNTFPTTINGDLEATLILGNSAGGNDINMNNQNITNCAAITANGTSSITNANSMSSQTVTILANGSLLAAGAGTIQLAETDMQGNLNMKGTDNVKNNILEAGIIAGETISANGFANNEGRISAAREISTSIYQVTTPYDGQSNFTNQDIPKCQL